MKQSFKTAITTIHNKLKDTNVNWALFGSMNLLLQGLPVEPNDIDVLTDDKGAYEMEKLLSEYSTKKVKYCSDGKVTSHFGALGIDGVKAEIVGDYTSNKDMKLIFDMNDKIMVNFEGMLIPCMPLEKELAAYDKEERSERVKMIQQYLNNQN
jgi:hypothetical protein